MSHFAPWPWPRVLAHRGGGTLAPENTLAAIRAGCARGFRGIEVDAMLSSDDVPVLMHDAQLGRTVAGQGSVADLAARDLMALDAGRWFSPAFACERVPSLRAALALCGREGLAVNVEIKPAPGHEARTGAVVAKLVAQACAQFDPPVDLDQPPGARTPLLSSFSLAALQAARAAEPRLPRGLLVHRVPRDWQAQLEKLGCVALHADHLHLGEAQAAAIKAAGYWLFCYTVDTPRRAREILRWGVDAFCTDRIDRMPPDLTP